MPTAAAVTIPQSGIFLGEGCYYDPEQLPNGLIIIVGASGSGKTQTLKAVGWELTQTYPSIRLVVVDFHGDQQLPGETRYALDMESPHGINPLVIDLDTKAGGPDLQAIATTATFKKALTMGTNQEGLFLNVLSACYHQRGIIQEDPSTWRREPPNFDDVRAEIEERVEEGCKESMKLERKFAATFRYGIFSKTQPPLTTKITRFDLSALGKVEGLGAIAADAIAKQLLDSHRIMGEIKGRLPRTYLFIDEAKEVKNSRAVKLIFGDGRKYGLACVLASQRTEEFSAEAIANASTKIVLPVDVTDYKKVASKFRFAESKVASLKPLEALVRMGTQAKQVNIVPFWQRVQG